jgi:hypothetical protein
MPTRPTQLPRVGRLAHWDRFRSITADSASKAGGAFLHEIIGFASRRRPLHPNQIASLEPNAFVGVSACERRSGRSPSISHAMVSP